MQRAVWYLKKEEEKTGTFTTPPQLTIYIKMTLLFHCVIRTILVFKDTLAQITIVHYMKET